MTICPQARSLWENWAGFSSIPKQGDFPCCQLRRENPAKGELHKVKVRSRTYIYTKIELTKYVSGQVTDEHVPCQRLQPSLSKSNGSNTSPKERFVQRQKIRKRCKKWSFHKIATSHKFHSVQVDRAQSPPTYSPHQAHPITWGNLSHMDMSSACLSICANSLPFGV